MTVQKILTPRGIASFLQLQKPKAISEGAEPEILGQHHLRQGRTSDRRVPQPSGGHGRRAKEKWPAKLPVGLISPFHDAARKRPYDGYKPGEIYISPWSKGSRRAASTLARKTSLIGPSSTPVG